MNDTDMKHKKKDILFFTVVACVLALLVFMTTSCIDEEAEKKNYVTRTYELVDKTTEVRTHRYLMVENAVETDHILVWKSSTGSVFTCEASRSNFYKYEKGKRYNFTIDKRQPEKWQIENKFRY